MLFLFHVQINPELASSLRIAIHWQSTRRPPFVASFTAIQNLNLGKASSHLSKMLYVVGLDGSLIQWIWRRWPVRSSTFHSPDTYTIIQLVVQRPTPLEWPIRVFVCWSDVGGTASFLWTRTKRSISSTDAPIFLIRPPKFVVLDLSTKSSSNPTILRCVVDSFPRARISWHRYGEKLADGALFNLENITTSEQQGIYTYRIETDGFQLIQEEFVIFIKGLDSNIPKG